VHFEYHVGSGILYFCIRMSDHVVEELVDAVHMPSVGAACWLAIADSAMRMVVGATLENFPLENPKKLILVPRMQLKLGKRAMPKVAFSQLPSSSISPISLNAMFIEIDPHGKEFAMNIPEANGIGNAVAQGHHLHVPLRCQNHELSTPSGEKPPTEHHKTP
jgi:hypothetical protein